MNLSVRLGKTVITEEQIKRKKEAEQIGQLAKEELKEAKELAAMLRDMREKNHFAAGFRRALGGGNDGR